MKRKALATTLALCALALFAPASAGAQGFGFQRLAIGVSDEEGNPSMQAGSHPFALTTELELNSEEDPELGRELPVGQLRGLSGSFSPGLTGSPFAVPQCAAAEFATTVSIAGIRKPDCPDASVVGLVNNRVSLADGSPAVSINPVYNLVPPPGVAASLGFLPYGGTVPPVTIDIGIEDTPPFGLTFEVPNVTQMVSVFSADLSVWGDPSDPAHDGERGLCGLFLELNGVPLSTGGSCPVNTPDRPFLTLPRSCEGPIATSFLATSWTGDRFAGSAQTEDEAGPLPTGGCGRLALPPHRISARPTTDRAQSPSGLDFGLDVEDPDLTASEGIAGSDIKKAIVTLPEGMTVNPSQAEGLAVCSEADFARETASSEFGAGCPAASKIGTTEVETPLLEGKILKGSLFVAKPYENPSGSLIALYMTFKEPSLGIGIKLAGRVEPDPVTGRLRTTFDDLPQQPFSHFRLHFREGGRSPLITPPACGAYTTEALFTPWSDPQGPLPSSASFQITGGPAGSPCPPSGPAPFHPGFGAGTLNNQAGSYSPFVMGLTRKDGEQDMGRFSFVLPPGVVPKLAGIPYCPEAGIARAKGRTGAHGGEEELAAPSCPAASQIGRTVAGAGVGSQLTYVPGSLYLAGPYHGDPISAVAITPAVAGPFDAGAVVVREALRLNPETYVGEVDGAASDPIPHILKGIPLNVRDLRVYADRPEFTLNATSCEPFMATATIWGDGTALAPGGDTPAGLGSRYQAAGCAGLGFEPKLGIKLKGGTRRGKFPALHAVYTPRPGDANLSRLALTFPRSEFIEQGHFGTICTRVQFAAGAGFGSACPPGSVYGQIRAWSPLLAQPLEGPVYLRSSSHNLPDAVFALHGLVDIAVAVRIDSSHGGLRATVGDAPDAPVSRAIVDMHGGHKGLFVNSTDICKGKHRAKARLIGQNGRLDEVKPVVRAQCKAKKKRKQAGSHRHGGRR
jgi:hypothetical protein